LDLRLIARRAQRRNFASSELFFDRNANSEKPQDERGTADKPRQFCRDLFFGRLIEAACCQAGAVNGLGGQGESDFLDVLGGGGQQALAGDGNEPSEANIAMTVELFGIGEGTLDGLFPTLADALAQGVSRAASTRSRASAQT
jgi:hypothetical protein